MEVDDPRYARLGNDELLLLFSRPADPCHSDRVCKSPAPFPVKSSMVPPRGPPRAFLFGFDQMTACLARPSPPPMDPISSGDIRAGQYTVTPQLPPGLQKSWTIAASESVSVAIGEKRAGVDFNLVPGVFLSGVVLSADDSRPIADVRLGIYNSAYPRDNGYAQTVTTDANGAFSVRVPPGQQNVYVMYDTPAEGFSRPIEDERNITIPEKGEGSVQFRLPRAFFAPIRGKVVDPDGNPAAAASVLAYSDQFLTLNNMRSSFTTNADGEFQTSPVPRTIRVAFAPASATWRRLGRSASLATHRGASRSSSKKMPSRQSSAGWLTRAASPSKTPGSCWSIRQRHLPHRRRRRRHRRSRRLQNRLALV